MRCCFPLVLLFVVSVTVSLNAAEIVVEARRVESSRRPTIRSIAPYRDALVVDEFHVGKVIAGDVEAKTLRVAQWAVRDGVDQRLSTRSKTVRLQLQPLDDFKALRSVTRSDTLPENLDATVYLHVDQSLRLPAAGVGSYANGLDARMKTLHLLRGQLELVVWGDSRTEGGVDASVFYGEDDDRYPRALNMAVASSGVRMLELLACDYLPHLPELKVVVVGFAPRMVSDVWLDRPGRAFAECKGYRRDRGESFASWRKQTVAPVSVQTLRQARELAWRTRPWGGDEPGSSVVDNPTQQRTYRAAVKKPRWRWNTLAWLRLKRTLTELDRRGVAVLLFTPPNHPAFGETDVVSEDGITREGYEEVMSRLRVLAGELNGLTVLDINRGGQHGWPAEWFRDMDHVNRHGWEALSRQLDASRKRLHAPKAQSPRDLLDEVDAEPLRVTGTTAGLKWVDATKGADLYVDRNYALHQRPKLLQGARLLQTANDTKREPATKVVVRFTIDRPSRVWLGIQERQDNVPTWMADWQYVRQTLETSAGRRRLFYRDVSAGEVALRGMGEMAADQYVVFVQALRQDR